MIPVVTDPKKAAGALNWAVAEMIPNAHFIAGNAFARFLEGAKPVKQLNVLTGINGFLYRTRDGKEIAAIWSVNEGETFKVDLSSSTIRAYDLFGNALPADQTLTLTADPCYLAGDDLSRSLKTVSFHPERACVITGVRRSAENGKEALAVELQNRTAGPIERMVRLRGTTPLRRITIPPQERKVLFFPVKAERKELTLLLSDGKSVESHTLPLADTRYLRKGESVSLKDCRFRVTSDAEALTISIDVSDRKRGERPANAPWEGDCIELFLDSRPSDRLERNPYTAHVYRLFLAPKSANGLPEEFSGSRNLDLRKLTHTIRDTGTDYSATVTIPWKTLDLAGPAPIGFDLIWNNSDGKKRDSALPWAGNSFNWRDRFNFGIYIP